MISQLGLLSSFVFFKVLLGQNAFARTLDAADEHVNSGRSNALSLHDLTSRILGTRSTLNIIWSCLATIFACTWASVHMNVPPASDSEWKILRRRFKIMVYMLLLPELIMYWASKQWYYARKTAKKHSSRGWTITHGFFIGMGGFVLQEHGKNVRPLDIDDLEDGFEMKELDWPDVSEDEILDKSKGDYFTKGVVVLQTTWFIFQCIARGAMKLAITELEVITLGFAALSGVMCFFWFKKPLDVRRPVIVLARGPRGMKFSNKLEEEKTMEAGVSQGIRSSTDVETLRNSPNAQSDQSHDSNFPNSGSSPSQNVALFPNPPPEVLIRDKESYRRRDTAPHATTNTLELIGPRIGYRVSRREERHSLQARRLNPGNMTFLETALAPFQTLISDMYELKASGSLISQNNPKSTAPGCCYVSTFYAADRLQIDHKLSLFLFASGTVFGGIHCIAWANQFPSSIEEWAWKASALSVTILPSFFVIHWILFSLYNYAPTTHSFSFSIYGAAEVIKYVFYATANLRLGLMFFVYVLARTFLLVLPFISLRALPSSAYVDITWTNVVPHI